jgi:hypothetical protein
MSGLASAKLYEAQGRSIKTLADLENILEELQEDYKTSPSTKGKKFPTVTISTPDTCVFDIRINDKFVCGVTRDTDGSLDFSTRFQVKADARDGATNLAVYERITEIWNVWLKMKGYDLDSQAIAADGMKRVSKRLIDIYPPFVPILRGVILYPLPTNELGSTLGVDKYNPKNSVDISKVVFVYNPWFVTRYMALDVLAKKTDSCEKALMFTVLHELSHVVRGHIKRDSNTFSGLKHLTENAIQDVGINNFCMNELKQPMGDGFLGSGVYVDLVVGNTPACAEGTIKYLESLFSLFVPANVLKHRDVSLLSQIKPKDLVRVVIGAKIDDTSQIAGTLGKLIKYGFAAELKNIHADIDKKIDNGDFDIPDMPGVTTFKAGDLVIHIPTRSVYVVLGRHTNRKYYASIRIGLVADLRVLSEVSSDPNFGANVVAQTKPTNPNIYHLQPEDMILVNGSLDLHPKKIIAPGKLVVGPDGKICRVVSAKGASSVEIEPLSQEELAKANDTIRSNPKGYLETQLFGKPISEEKDESPLEDLQKAIDTIEDYVPPFRRFKEKEIVMVGTDVSFGTDFAEESSEGMDLNDLSFEEPTKPSLTDYRYVGKRILDSDF